MNFDIYDITDVNKVISSFDLEDEDTQKFSIEVDGEDSIFLEINKDKLKVITPTGTSEFMLTVVRK